MGNAIPSAYCTQRFSDVRPAERALKIRVRRGAQDLAELRLVLPDARSAAVRLRIAAVVDSLTHASERDALNWIEAVSEFDEPADQTPC